jgi:protein involved in polysaccharide export with SLBB domain
MKYGLKIAIISLLAISLGTTVFSQNVSPAVQQKALQELHSRGLDETEVRAKLKERGIDIDNIRQDQLPGLQPILEEIVKEIEAEKAAKKPVAGAAGKPDTAKMPAPKTAIPAGKDLHQISTAQAFRIQEKVNQGLSVQEAIAEELIKPDTAGVLPAQVYGQHLFRTKSLAIFRTTNEIKPPDTYVLSTGDIITVSIFGASQFDGKFEINREGFIQPSQQPKIFLKGLQLSQARALIAKRFGQSFAFKPEQIAINLTTARSITVNIFGETVNYGSFAMSAINTAVNALVAAGGPTNLGSVRNIQVIRGRTTKRLDLYEFMQNPSIQYDFFLEDNDIIHVPVAERIVSIQGSINRVFRYELVNGENLKRLLEYAGGFSADAYQTVLQVRRFVNDRQVLIDIPWSTLITAGQDFDLKNGDEVIVRAIAALIENTASIEGAVSRPGPYAIAETPRISDLLKKAGLKPEARVDAAFLLRQKPDQGIRLIQVNLTGILAQTGRDSDLVLQPKDKLVIYAQSRFTDRSTISVTGSVREPLIKYPYTQDTGLTVQRAILLAGGLKSDASGAGYILRTNPLNDKEKRYIRINFDAVMRDAGSKDNIVLQPNDRMEVLSQTTFSDASTVRVSGAVRNSGEFVFGTSMGLREAILFAGGFRLEAAQNRIDIFRLDMQANKPTRTVIATMAVDAGFFSDTSRAANFLLQPFDEVVVRSVPEFEFQRFVVIKGEVKYPGRYALTGKNEQLSDLVRQAGGLTEESFVEGATLLRTAGKKGLVVTDLAEAMRNQRSEHNHILQEGDSIVIPKREDLVSIKIENTKATELYADRYLPYGQINVAYKQGKRANWYINNYAAGFSKNAAKSKVSVIQLNGKIGRTVHIWPFRFYPAVQKGSIVSVGGRPIKTKAEQKEKKEINWDKVLTQILATVGTLATVTLAISVLKK